jgi:hypothetical protein
MCCIVWAKRNCASYESQPCGGFGFYGDIWTQCCENLDGSLSVLSCDSQGISLTWQPCLEGFSCVQRIGMSGNKRSLGMYAQCEVNP